jgi:hypothetical protein
MTILRALNELGMSHGINVSYGINFLRPLYEQRTDLISLTVLLELSIK